jgi:hypothetical protein
VSVAVDRRYTGFVVVAATAYFTWVGLLLTVALAQLFHLLDITELEGFETSVSLPGYSLHLHKDLAYTSLLTSAVVVIRVALRRRMPALFWVDFVGGMVGLLLVVGFVYWRSLTLGGDFPSTGIDPNSWGGLALYSLIVGAVLLGVHLALFGSAKRKTAAL